MNEQELKLILQEGEGLNVEFKESFDPKGFAKAISAFANSSGGRILLGVSDKGRITGIEVTNSLKSQIQDVARNCDPPVKIVLESAGKVIVVSVKEGGNKPYQCSEGFYIREGANTQKLSRDEITGMIIRLGKVRFDRQINDDFRFPEDFNYAKFDEFLRKCGISKNNPTEDILANLSLGKKNGRFRLNNTGILFFGRNIGRFIRQNFITCVLYKGTGKLKIIDKKDFNGDLQENLEQAANFLKRNLRLEYIIEGIAPRKEVLELPEEALREALLNAIIHRDYFEEGTGIFVEIFDDRAEIYNKGELLFDRKELGKVSLARNPIIFDMFHRLEFIEKAGSGIKKIRELMKKRGLKVRFETSEFFRVIFIRPPSGFVASRGNREKTREKTREKILELIWENPQITTNTLAERTGLTEKGIEWNIARLRKEGVLKRIGPDKGGHWELKEGKGK